ncbi:hypothetical protein PFISCL1PPCAC_21127, partial [Pristionchus fissidentatus]
EEVTEEFGMERTHLDGFSDDIVIKISQYLRFEDRKNIALACRRFTNVAKRIKLRAVDVTLKPNFRSIVVNGKVLMKFDSDHYFPLMSTVLDGVWINNLLIECKDPRAFASNNFLALFRNMKFTSLSIHFYFDTIPAYESIDSYMPSDKSNVRVLDVLMRKGKLRDADVTVSWDRNVNQEQLALVNEWLLTLPQMRSLTIDWEIFRSDHAIDALTFCDVFH